jgi:hypothetical protein
MTWPYIPTALRQIVQERAGGRCEYCLYPQDMSFLAFEVEHIVAEKHSGTTTVDNLALACPYCNRFKGTDLGSLDLKPGNWFPFSTHEHNDGLSILGLTARRSYRLPLKDA